MSPWSGREADGRQIDPYGEPTRGNVRYRGGRAWKRFIDNIDGSAFFQLRFTFVNDEAEAASPTLSGVGVAFRGP